MLSRHTFIRIYPRSLFPENVLKAIRLAASFDILSASLLLGVKRLRKRIERDKSASKALTTVQTPARKSDAQWFEKRCLSEICGDGLPR